MKFLKGLFVCGLISWLLISTCFGAYQFDKVKITGNLSVEGMTEVTTLEFADETSMTTIGFIGTTDADARYIDTAGDTLTGVLTAGAVNDYAYFDLSRVGTADSNFEGVNKLQMDTADALKVDIAGDTLTGVVTSSVDIYITTSEAGFIVTDENDVFYRILVIGATITIETL